MRRAGLGLAVVVIGTWVWADEPSVLKTETAASTVSVAAPPPVPVAPTTSAALSTRTLPIALPSIPNKAFRAGESLTFCDNGKMLTVDCGAIGFATCNPNNGGSCGM